MVEKRLNARRKDASGPEIGLPGRILARFCSGAASKSLLRLQSGLETQFSGPVMFHVAPKADCTRTPPEKIETHATALLPAPYDRSIAYCNQCVVLAGLRRTARSHNQKNSCTVLMVPRWRERRWPWPEVWRHPRRVFSCTFTPSEAFDVAGVIALVPALVIAFTYRCRLLVATLARASCFKRILPLGASPRGGGSVESNSPERGWILRACVFTLDRRQTPTPAGPSPWAASTPTLG